MNLSLKKETSNRATLLNIKEASLWASKYLNKKVTPSNISYLIQYGKIAKKENKGTTCIQKNMSKNYNKAIELNNFTQQPKKNIKQTEAIADYTKP